MSLASGSLFGRLDGLGLRRFAAWYLLVFLAAVAIAPHRHANSLEDLLSDGPSDSGVFVEQPPGQTPGSGPSVSTARIVDDDVCLACFHHDSITEEAAISFFEPGFEAVPMTIRSWLLEVPAASVSRSRSRAPPPVA